METPMKTPMGLRWDSDENPDEAPMETPIWDCDEDPGEAPIEPQ